MENETLPLIHKRTRKVAPNGTILEEKALTVQGKDLKKVAKEFDKRWNDGN